MSDERIPKPDHKRINDGDYIRASGECVCATCQFPYRDHDTVPGARWLHRACDGRLLKL